MKNVIVKWGPRQIARLLLSHTYHPLQLSDFLNTSPEHEESVLGWIMLPGNHQVLLERHITIPPPPPLVEFEYVVHVAEQNDL